MKPYQLVPIQDCGEPLVPIPLDQFVVEIPPPYVKLGADYDGKSPYYLRQGVLTALIKARDILNQLHPQWQIKVFDAYRPVCVQQFMVDYTFAQVLKTRGLSQNQLSPAQKEEIWQEVYQIWAIPSDNPATPPPHSTGSAIDLTLIDATGKVVDMGGEIDELSERSQPDYYANRLKPQEQAYHRNRELLNQIMTQAGFCRHRGEWWHFSLGDQMYTWLRQQDDPDATLIARYGKI